MRYFLFFDNRPLVNIVDKDFQLSGESTREVHLKEYREALIGLIESDHQCKKMFYIMKLQATSLGKALLTLGKTM